MAELDVLNAAVALGVSPDTVRRRIRSGAVEARRDASGKWMVTVEVPAAVPAPPGQDRDGLQTIGDELERAREEISRLRERLSSSQADAARLQEEARGLRVLLDEVRTSRDRAYADAADLWQMLGRALAILPTATKIRGA